MAHLNECGSTVVVLVDVGSSRGLSRLLWMVVCLPPEGLRLTKSDPRQNRPRQAQIPTKNERICKAKIYFRIQKQGGGAPRRSARAESRQMRCNRSNQTNQLVHLLQNRKGKIFCTEMERKIHCIETPKKTRRGAVATRANQGETATENRFRIAFL